ncbi:MAG TPA: plastocyanin/azurin family copper-binding protein, partial [Longimicrobiaceae bacterium]|nr:plastocyanin/azurin family copper-binding protein [Longimicrobiaceae bacterium]
GGSGAEQKGQNPQVSGVSPREKYEQYTSACFEPTIDYCVIKIPRWTFEKFPDADETLTTQNGASGQFEPAQVTAKPGDVLHFVPDGGAAHNVSWPAADNPGKTGLPPASPYVTAPEQAVDQVVSMGPGTYNFQCDPHAPMGMKGTLTVS